MDSRSSSIVELQEKMNLAAIIGKGRPTKKKKPEPAPIQEAAKEDDVDELEASEPPKPAPAKEEPMPSRGQAGGSVLDVSEMISKPTMRRPKAKAKPKKKFSDSEDSDEPVKKAPAIIPPKPKVVQTPPQPKP